MTMHADVQDVLDRIKTAQQKPLGDPRFKNLIGLEKAGTFSESASPTSGLTFYDLELGAKFLYPVLTPLRNMIPRVSGKGGIQAAWRAITAINTTGLRFGVSSANRGGVLAVTTHDYTATYKGIGVETSVDFEAQYAGQGFDDVRAVGAKTGLEALMLGEEAMILGGSTSTPLGATPTPTLTASTTGGTLAAQTWSVICAALTLDGLYEWQHRWRRARVNHAHERRRIDGYLRWWRGETEHERDRRHDRRDRVHHRERHAGLRCAGLCLVLGCGGFRNARRDYDD
jgi:hypothetical protein